MRIVILLFMLAAVVACGGSDTEDTAPAAVSPTSSTSPSTTSSPTPLTLDGAWSGSTSSGEDVSFTVRGDEIRKVEMPQMNCGLGMSPTIQTGTDFKGRTFRVEALPLPYTISSRGESYTAQDVIVMTGRFTSGTSAKGAVKVEVYNGQTVTDSCSVTWTASH